MREIKFRAWDNVENQIVYFNFFDIEKGKIPYQIIGDHYWFNLHRQPVMQFINLHDKNGKEIYEGDILKTNFGDTGSVVWFRRGFYINKFSDKPDDILVWEKSEVIGNVHENPELLK